MASHQGVLTLALTVVLLALPSPTYGVTLHVRPASTNTSCPTHPCHTLTEYAQGPEQYFNDSNLTLQFLPGTHTLNVNLTITNIHQLEIHGAVLPSRVVCDSRVGFAFSNIYKVRIDGLAFVSCARSGMVHGLSTRTHNGYYPTYYGLLLQSVQMAEIIDCTFQDSYGSALGVVDSHLILRVNRFLNNCRLCSNGCGNYLTPICYGGGIFVQRSNLNITGNIQRRSNVYIRGNTTFSGNSAMRDGGGVYAWDSSDVAISGNATFGGNSARNGGGGAVSVLCSNVYISGNAMFSRNFARVGGCVFVQRYHQYCSSTSTVSLNLDGNVNFTNCSATNDGGAIHASGIQVFS